MEHIWKKKHFSFGVKEQRWRKSVENNQIISSMCFEYRANCFYGSQPLKDDTVCHASRKTERDGQAGRSLGTQCVFVRLKF